MDNKKELINLYLEQIKYLRQENILIQDKFLASVSIPLSVLGVIVYYIETSLSKGNDFSYFYLFLLFLYLLIPYNTIKYSIRMMGINGYIKYLEGRINMSMEGRVFSWNTRLINSGCFGGFAFITTIPQVVIYIVCFIFLYEKYLGIQKEGVYFKEYYFILNLFLVILILFIILMLFDLLFVQHIIVEKLNSNKDAVRLEEVIKKMIKKRCHYDGHNESDTSFSTNEIKELEALFAELDSDGKKELLDYAYALSLEQTKHK